MSFESPRSGDSVRIKVDERKGRKNFNTATWQLTVVVSFWFDFTPAHWSVQQDARREKQNEFEGCAPSEAMISWKKSFNRQDGFFFRFFVHFSRLVSTSWNGSSSCTMRYRHRQKQREKKLSAAPSRVSCSRKLFFPPFSAESIARKTRSALDSGEWQSKWGRSETRSRSRNPRMKINSA